MQKIKIVLGGGLGNQLFQYAAYEYVKETYPHVELSLDMFQYKYDAFHNGIEFQKIFSTEMNEEIKQIECFRNMNKISKKYPSLFHVLKNKLIGYRTFYDDSINSPDKMDIVIKHYNKCLFAGFYQNPQFVEKIECLLRKKIKKDQMLGPFNDELIKLIDGRISVSLHIRRGDYINISKYDVFNGLTYYENAIKLFYPYRNKLIFIVFSNDMDWVKDNLKLPDDVIYVDWNANEDSFKDMILMSKCTHNIIANSSFSWWGAWLNDNPEKIVIAPEFWFKGLHSCNVVPSNWKLINC